jgi:hypothetical protein
LLLSFSLLLPACGFESDVTENSFYSEVTDTSSNFENVDTDSSHDFWKIGDVGPGGGIIVYVNESGFSGWECQIWTPCHVLEVAPNDVAGMFDITEAKNAAESYETALADDWVLPTIETLNHITEARKFVSNLVDSSYWSNGTRKSSIPRPWVFRFFDENGSSSPREINADSGTHRVRAVRAFSSWRCSSASSCYPIAKDYEIGDFTAYGALILDKIKTRLLVEVQREDIAGLENFIEMNNYVDDQRGVQGWRLPTLCELEKIAAMPLLKTKIWDGLYWSLEDSWVFDMSTEGFFEMPKIEDVPVGTARIRLVRTIGEIDGIGSVTKLYNINCPKYIKKFLTVYGPKGVRHLPRTTSTYPKWSVENFPDEDSTYWPDDSSNLDDYPAGDCVGDCNDMDGDGRTWDDVDADGDGNYESP